MAELGGGSGRGGGGGEPGEDSLGLVRVLGHDITQEDPTSLLGAVPKFWQTKPQPSSSNKAGISSSSARLWRRIWTALPLGMAAALRKYGAGGIHKPPVILSSQHRTTITLNTIKANTRSNSRSALLPFNASHSVNSPLKNHAVLSLSFNGRHSFGVS